MTTVYELIEEAKKKNNTLNNTYSDFPVGTRVKVITLGQDMTFFRGDETGIVIRNHMRYLGIIVQFDEALHYTDGFIRTEFNFEPSDLIKHCTCKEGE